MIPVRPPKTVFNARAPWATAVCFVAWAGLCGAPVLASDAPAAKPAKASAAAKPGKHDDSAAAPASAPPAHGAAAHAASPAPASAAASAPSDALDQLRQRLAEKLQGGKAAPSASPYDVRVVARSAPTAAPAHAPAPPVADSAHAPAPKTSAKASAHTASASKKPAAGHADVHAHWAYNGAAGPQSWGGLKPEFTLCGSGQRQSPIDIRGGLAVDLEPVRFAYQESRFGVIDNGHTVQANMAQGNAIEVAGKRFDLLQLHFHRPSEERIDGRQFEMSVHLVHKDDQGRLAVVTVLLDKGPAQPAVQKVWNNLPLEQHAENAARTLLDLNELLPTDRRYFTYMGSLTTPPCTEGVQWIVMRQPVTLSPEQIDLFARIYPMNARPVQQAAGRRIMQSQ
jgi:carbonic anhydrase